MSNELKTYLARCLTWGVVVFLVLAAAMVLARAGEPPVLPDLTLTPGVVATTDQALVCASGNESYSRQHRQTSEALKSAVRKEYGTAACGEIDHRLPLSLGGADALANLWCQSGPAPDEGVTPTLTQTWNFKLKDRLEDRIWDAVCHKRTMTLAEGQAIFLAPDWRIAYCKYVGGPPCP